MTQRIWRLTRVALLACTLASAPVLADGGIIPLLVTGFRIEDQNGDLDGFADTNETVAVHFYLSNGSSLTLTNVEVRVSTADPKVDCVTASISVGSLAAHADSAPLVFKFKVNPQADRGGAGATCNAGICSNFVGPCITAPQCARTVQHDYSVTFDFQVLSFEGSQPDQSLRVDLDLNAVNAAMPSATVIEGFETGLGTFTLMNLDANIASNSASNGKRCQYNDPDYPYSNSYGESECYLGFAAGQPIENDWHSHSSTSPDGGRAFLGSRSLHYGVHAAGAPNPDRYGLSQMDAVRSGILNLAARVCANDPSADKRACATAADCFPVGGGDCVPARPELSFKHQVSTLDSRENSIPYGQSTDRAVVMAQVNPSGVWQKLVPYVNTYDVQGTDDFSSCLFDPDDDGNNEDSYFDPSDPQRRLGPSSTCYPGLAFSFLGDTDERDDPTQIGRASHGPGLWGSLGIGVWVESRIDLSAYRGRRIRLRWLFTTIKISDWLTTASLHMAQTPVDDGWYVDDVRVTQTLGAATATTSLDPADNSGLGPCDLDGDGITSPADNCPDTANAGQGDEDFDGVGDACDVCPAAADPLQADADRDDIGNVCDACPGDPFNIDGDLDGPCDLEDNCPTIPNSDQQNSDGDPAGNACDCAPSDATAFELVEITAVKFYSDKITLYWPYSHSAIGNDNLFEVVRGLLTRLPVGSGGSEICLEPQMFPSAYDAAIPPAGAGYWYVVRMSNHCGNGTYGFQSDEAERATQACP